MLRNTSGSEKHSAAKSWDGPASRRLTFTIKHVMAKEFCRCWLATNTIFQKGGMFPQRLHRWSNQLSRSILPLCKQTKWLHTRKKKLFGCMMQKLWPGLQRGNNKREQQSDDEYHFSYSCGRTNPSQAPQIGRA